jgi:hypothetical protein
MVQRRLELPELERARRVAQRCGPVVILCIAVGFAVWHRIGREAQQEAITGDEGISLLAATCHQTEFLAALQGQREPYGRWVSSKAWKRYTSIERFGCFGTISQDLAAVDFHPPLYFWILHVWLAVVGLHAWTFVGLNVLFALGTIAVMFLLGQRIFGSQLSAATLSLLWAASPLPAVAGVEGRPYELLAFVTAGFLAQLVHCCAPEPKLTLRPLAWLAAWVIAGLLTHYLFLIVLACAAVFAIARLARSPGSLIMVGMAVLLGIGVACTAHPVVRQLEAKHDRSPDSFGSARFSAQGQLVIGQERLFFDGTVSGFEHAWVVGSLGLIAIVLGWAATRRPGQVVSTQRHIETRGADILLVVVAASLVTAFFYASGRLPRHAMNAKYLSFLWTLFPFIPVVGIRLYVPTRQLLQALTVWVFIVAGLQNAPHMTTATRLVDAVASEQSQPLVYLTNSWHPTAASIARRSDDSQLFIAGPADGAGTLFEAWLHPVNAGQVLRVGAPTKYAEPILSRLGSSGYEVALPNGPKPKKPPPMLWFSVRLP